MLNSAISFLYLLTPAWALYLLLFKPSKIISFGLPTVFLVILSLLLFIDKQKIAENLAISTFLLFFVSVFLQVLHEKT